jgi:hypothetical protein
MPEFRVDPDLAPDERQVSFVGTQAADTVRVHSEVPVLCRRLMAHPRADVESVRRDGDTVHAVTATIPVGCLKVSAEGRSRDTWGPVVSKQVEVDDDES